MQRPTLEAAFDDNILAPGGVYMCEDLHGSYQFFSYVLARFGAPLGVAMPSNFFGTASDCNVTTSQRIVSSLSIYPYLLVLERRKAHWAEEELCFAPRHGTSWAAIPSTLVHG